MVHGLGGGYSSYCVIYVRPLGSNEVRILWESSSNTMHHGHPIHCIYYYVQYRKLTHPSMVLCSNTSGYVRLWIQVVDSGFPGPGLT